MAAPASSSDSDEATTTQRGSVASSAPAHVVARSLARCTMVTPILFLVYAVLHGWLLTHAPYLELLQRVDSRRQWYEAALVTLLLLGLVYDNLVLALGSFVRKPSAWFERLQRVRFVMHGGVLPLLLAPLSLAVLELFVSDSATSSSSLVVLLRSGIVLVALLIGAHGTLDNLRVRLEPKHEYGMLRYVPNPVLLNNILHAVLVTVLAVVVGIVHLRATGSYALLGSASVMFFAASLPHYYSFVGTNAAEVAFMYGVIEYLLSR